MWYVSVCMCASIQVVYVCKWGVYVSGVCKYVRYVCREVRVVARGHVSSQTFDSHHTELLECTPSSMVKFYYMHIKYIWYVLWQLNDTYLLYCILN